jgi:hypothetical protein
MTIRSSSVVFALAIVTLAGVVYSQSTSGGSSKPSQFHLFGSYEKLFGSNLEGMEKPVTKVFDQTPLFQVLNQLASGPFHLVADSAAFGDIKISSTFNNQPLGKCLDELAGMMDARWEQNGKTLKLRPTRVLAMTHPGPVVEVEGFPIDEIPQGFTWNGDLDHSEGIKIEIQDGKPKFYKIDKKTKKYRELSDKEAKALSEKLHIDTKNMKEHLLKLKLDEKSLHDYLLKMKVDGDSLQFAFPHGEFSKEDAQEMKKFAEQFSKQMADGMKNFKFDFKMPEGVYNFSDGKPQKWDPKTKKMVPMTPEEHAAFKKKMEAFGKDMEKWGEKFGKEWEKKGKAFEFQYSKEHAKEWEAQEKKWEEYAKQHKAEWEKMAKEWEKSGAKGHTFVLPKDFHGFMLKDGRGLEIPLEKLKEMKELPLKLKELEKLHKLDGKLPMIPKTPGHETGVRLIIPSQQNIPALLKSVSDEQRAIMKERGYIKWSELTAEQKKLIGFEPKGEFSLTFTIDGTTLSIKND